jgi:isoaspartyl peptidase/L-asparaginase-like protein (Ntn-hydrolase superfamily)
MSTRRTFIKQSALASTLVAIGGLTMPEELIAKPSRPIVLSTWNFGLQANEAAWNILSHNGSALDAVEVGVKITEADPKISSVGYGGFPDRDGKITLDACIMDDKGNCGAVVFLEHILHPVSVARAVMEKTPHVLLAGEGALQFALAHGFKKQNLLTPESKEAWEKWCKEHQYSPMKIDRDNHDTIGMLALDAAGNLSGACTTSGLAWKIHGRVGDSPIIGAGLYVDNEIGAATATGKGEAVIKMCGSFLIVELMRNGKSPAEACKIAVERIAKQQSDYKDFQVGFLALNKHGETGGYAIAKGFQYAVHTGENVLIDAEYFIKA